MHLGDYENHAAGHGGRIFCFCALCSQAAQQQGAQVFETTPQGGTKANLRGRAGEKGEGSGTHRPSPETY
jgi:hypothetical protein|eukprot:COSAG01_NODE_3665_length_5813_cov_11.013126_4_plen_70_part_00